MAVTCLHRHSQMLVDTNNYVSKKFSLKVLPLVGTDRQICILFSWRESGMSVHEDPPCNKLINKNNAQSGL